MILFTPCTCGQPVFKILRGTVHEQGIEDRPGSVARTGLKDNHNVTSEHGSRHGSGQQYDAVSCCTERH